MSVLHKKGVPYWDRTGSRRLESTVKVGDRVTHSNGKTGIYLGQAKNGYMKVRFDDGKTNAVSSLFLNLHKGDTNLRNMDRIVGPLIKDIMAIRSAKEIREARQKQSAINKAARTTGVAGFHNQQYKNPGLVTKILNPALRDSLRKRSTKDLKLDQHNQFQRDNLRTIHSEPIHKPSNFGHKDIGQSRASSAHSAAPTWKQNLDGSFSHSSGASLRRDPGTGNWSVQHKGQSMVLPKKGSFDHAEKAIGNVEAGKRMSGKAMAGSKPSTVKAVHAQRKEAIAKMKGSTNPVSPVRTKANIAKHAIRVAEKAQPKKMTPEEFRAKSARFINRPTNMDAKPLGSPTQQRASAGAAIAAERSQSALPRMKGKKGGTYVVTKSGRKRYVK